MQKTQRTVQISSNIIGTCEVCQKSVRGNIEELIHEEINHYLQAHGFKLLHVGTQTTEDRDGKPWHTTVAIVGK